MKVKTRIKILAALVLIMLVLSAGPVIFNKSYSPAASAQDGFEGYMPISTAAELNAVRNDVTKSYYLTCDIDLGGAEWTPIGDADNNYFDGIFDGNGYKVHNFKMSGRPGLFGINRNTIRNLGVTDFVLNSSSSLSVGALAATNVSAIENCYVSSGTAIRANAGLLYVGGLVGHSYGTYARILNCRAEVDITVPGGSLAYAGGLIGINVGIIHDSFASGNITVSASGNGVCAGGLAGRGPGQFINSYATGNVKVMGSYGVSAGGLVGKLDTSGQSGQVIDCYATGSVETSNSARESYAGGLIGDSVGTVSGSYALGAVSVDWASLSYNIYAGGLIGRQTAPVSNCYALGSVNAATRIGTGSGNIYAGGLTGESGNISNSYALGDVHVEASGNWIFAGGLTGRAAVDASISNCYAKGGVYAKSDYDIFAGGFAGEIRNKVSNSYATGDVQALSTDGYICAGGFAGEVWQGEVRNSYATGNIEASLSRYGLIYAGGFAGMYSGIAENCFAAGDIFILDLADSGAIAGGFTAFPNFLGAPNNSYRKIGQIITVNDESLEELWGICTEGIEAAAEELQDGIFITQNLLWGTYISESDRADNPDNVWVLSENAYPVLFTEPVEGAPEFRVMGGNYGYPAYIEFTQGDAMVDGEPYISGTPLSEYGYYRFSITHNGITVNRTITVEPLYQGLTDNMSVYGITFFMNGWHVDDEPYTYGTEITQIGNHTLQFFGKDGYVKTFNFTVIAQIAGVTNGGTYLGSVIPNVAGDLTGGSLLLNGAEFINETEITQIGAHTLEITGVNGYTKTIRFTLRPFVSGVANDGQYTGSVTPNIVWNGLTPCSITLNGSAYEPGIPISNVGPNELVFHGVNDYTLNISFTVIPSITGVADGGSYSGSATPAVSGGTLKLNGQDYTSGTIISTPGSYKLEIFGAGDYTLSINFTVNPSISGVADGGSYSGSVTPVVSGGTLKLNGEEYVSGTIITMPGDYELEIFGIGDYTLSISFTVNPSITGVADSTSYSGSVTPVVSGGTLKLNGQAYISGTVITTPGYYKLEIFGIGSNKTTIYFTVEAVISGVENGGSYTGSVIPVVPGGTLTLNDEPFISGTEVSAVGFYLLEVTGGRGYYMQAFFYILPVFSGVANGGSYTGSATPVVSGGTLKLNGEDYTSGTNISTPGSYKLEVFGAGGYKTEINFTVSFAISGVANGGQYSGGVTPVVSGGTLTMNGAPFTSGTEISAVGYYRLEILGTNGYSQTINFTVLPVISGITDGVSYWGSVTPVINNCELILRYAGNDGVLYTSGTPITKFGGYYLEIRGAGGYVKVIYFTVNVSAEGIESGAEYSGSVTPVISGGDIYLNGVPFISGTRIEAPGIYEILIKGAGKSETKINFIVKVLISGVEDGGEYTGAVRPEVSGGRVLLNGREYNFSDIDVFGEYILAIYGAGDYVKTVKFSIQAAIFATELKFNSFEFTLSSVHKDTIIELDGVIMTGSFTVTHAGNHRLLIVNPLGYFREINFIVEYTGNLPQGDTVKKVIILKPDDGVKIYLNGKEVTGETQIFKTGNYTVKVVGANGYEKIYSFEFENRNDKFLPYVLIPSVAVFAAAVCIMILRRKRV